MGERRADHIFRDNIAQPPAAPMAAPPPAYPPTGSPTLGALLVALMRAQAARSQKLAFPERKETKP
jgi:hypothetical protein